MGKKTVKVQCIFCKKYFAPSGLKRHFLSCGEKRLRDEAEVELVKKAKGVKGRNNKRVFLVKAFSPYKPQYWLIIEANLSATLKELDGFLRDIWLECCGHLSSFDINGTRYDSDTTSYFGESPASMNIQLGEVLQESLQFDYEYDFGSTTHLKLKVTGERTGRLYKKPIQLLARNPEPVYDCVECSQRATLICTECEEIYCESCIDEHGCDEDMSLPLVNSPRTGVCGYAG